jgi:glycosyltransferase involved in cell wall biosynthesis
MDGTTIGIDARAAAEEPAGRGRVTRELIAALSRLDLPQRFLLYCREPWQDVTLGPRLRWAPVGLPDPLWHAAVAARATRACDAFLSTNSYLTAWMLGTPSVVLVHDLVAFLPDARAQSRAARIERATIRPAIRRAARLACVSESTERDLVRFFPRAAGRTGVTPLAADRRFYARPEPAQTAAVATRHGVEPERFVLAVGTLEPRKNLLRLIRAHSALDADLRDAHPLLIVGPRGWEEQEILDAAAAAGSEQVRLAGYVPDEDLVALYAACGVFAYPSLYEGFGLPVLEAMAAGAAVLTSPLSSLPEVGGDAVAYADPRDEDAIGAELGRLLSSPAERERLGARGRERAERFSWEATARAVLHELEVACSR